MKAAGPRVVLVQAGMAWRLLWLFVKAARLTHTVLVRGGMLESFGASISTTGALHLYYYALHPYGALHQHHLGSPLAPVGPSTHTSGVLLCGRTWTR